MIDLMARGIKEGKWRGNDLNEDVNQQEKIVQYVINCHTNH